ncbi:MAG: HEAT repeat domain-containing protein, partial [Bacteroidales bacterium]|nr:HEAT repeat domain-containing protein [Bacteroidales bacterium]
MKLNKYAIIWLVAIFSTVESVQSQDKPATDLDVAGIIARMPVQDQTQLNNQMILLLESGEEGLQELLDMIIPPGTGDDTGARFAVESLSRFLSQPGKGYQRVTWEAMLLAEIEDIENPAIKSFLMSQLNYIGGDATVEWLGKYLTDNRLHDPAIRAMRDANPEKAGKIFAVHLDKISGNPQIALVNALGELGLSEHAPAVIKLAGTTDPELQKSVVSCMEKMGLPGDQRLLIIRKMESGAQDEKAKRQLITAAGDVKTFLSFIFVSQYLDMEEFKSAAARSLVRIALPDDGKENGLSGAWVREHLARAGEILAGPGSADIKLDIESYLKEITDQVGYESMFNGKDLTGWQ